MNDLQQRLESALVKFQAGDTGASAAIYRDIVRDVPDQPDALHMLGIIAQQMGNTNLALQLFDEALKTAPHFGQALANRAVLLRAVGRNDEAFASAEDAIKHEPKLADGWDIAGVLLRERHRFDESLAHHQKAVALNPGVARFHANYGIILARFGRLHEAWQANSRAAQLNPKLATARLALGNIIKGWGYPERAIPYFQKAYALEPVLGEAHVNEALTHLLIGDIKTGLELMEKRFYDKKRFEGMPRWDGEKVKHLLIYGEQGMGDSLHFMRYIPLIRDQVVHITLQVPAPVQSVIQANLPDITVKTLDDKVTDANAFTLLLSLPLYCKTDLNNIPAPIPYIEAKPEWRAPWVQRLADRPQPRIGIVWAGNVFHLNDHNRSLSFAAIEPLLKSAAANFISMQKGPLNNAADLAGLGVFDANPYLKDFADSAGLIAELDLLIAVDTAPVHLAGAMGKPVWMLTPFDPDWRWLLGREDSPWYPSLKLFRQSAPGDWSSVLRQVEKELRWFLDGDREVLTAKRWPGKPFRENPNAVTLPDDVKAG